MTLIADGILIRPCVPDDAEAIFAAVVESHCTVGRWMSWCHPGYAIADAHSWIAHCTSQWSQGGDREFGIFDAESGIALGCIGVNQINRVHNIANVGYWVRASGEGRGIASTAARRVAAFAFAELGLSRIEIVALPDNVVSRRVAEKLGAAFECIARNRLLFRGQPREAAVYSLLPGDLAG